MELSEVKPIKSCHRCGFTFVTKVCSTCSNRASEKWRNANREKIAKKRSEQVEYHAARRKKYYEDNRDRVLATQKARYDADPEKSRVYSIQYRLKHPDYTKNYRDSHRDEIKASCALWRSKNPTYFKESYRKNRAARLAYAKQWRINNPEANKLKLQNRRARIRFGGGKLSRGLEARLMKLQRGLCPCCRRHLGRNYHLDHIVPLAKGGLNIDSNMQLLRAACNFQKSAKDPIVFMQQKGFLL